MIYFDTSYIAKCYVADLGFDKVRAFAEKHSGISSSEWAKVELASAIHRKSREGKITAKQCHAIHLQWENDEKLGLWNWLSLSSALIQKAIQKHRKMGKKIFIRAGDAIHLMTAVEFGFHEIYSHDRHLIVAAQEFGIKGVDILVPDR
jgi:predicted nucleic acid-binding protein